MFLKRKTFLILLLLPCVQLISGQIAWDWVKHSSLPGPDEANDIVVDKSKNIYVTGYHTNVELPMYNLKDKDAFVAKYDSIGMLKWYKKYGSEEADDIGNGIGIDGSNNVYVTGSYDYNKKMFLIKLDDLTGDLIWETFDSSLATNVGDDLVIKDSIIYITGTTPLLRYDLYGKSLQEITKSGKKSINTLDVVSSAIAINNSGLIYIARDNTILGFDSTGLQISSLQLNITRFNSLTIDNFNNIYCTGIFSGSTKLGNYQLKSSGYDDIFICKIDTSGNINWAVKAGGSDFDEGLGIAINKRSELYVTGFYRQIATFGNQTVGQLGLFKEIFVLKLDPETGNFSGLLVAGGGGDNDIGNKIAFDKDNFPYVVGILHNFWPGLNFGDIYIPSEDENSEDAFIAKIKVPDMISKLKGQVFKNGSETRCIVKLFSYSPDIPMRLLYNNYTTDSGSFEYTVYTPGYYFLQAIQPMDFNYAKTYYERNYNWDSAFHFSLISDTVITGINIHLLELPDLNGNDTISGTVYDVSGEPKRWIDMILIDKSGILADYTQTDTMGKYKFTSVPPGNYNIMIDSAGMFVKSFYTLNTTLKSNYIGLDYVLGEDSIFKSEDFKVLVKSDAFILDELSFNGTLVGYLYVTNQSRLKTINFTILEQDRNNAFGITPGSGKIFVSDSALINYENLSVHRLKIKVENTLPLYSSDTVDITIELQKAYRPIIKSMVISVDENSPIGMIIGKIILDESFVDPYLTYEIVSESYPGIFIIQSPDGEIIISDSSLLDYEKVQEIFMVVKVTESSIRHLTDTCTVVIRINDVNDNTRFNYHLIKTSTVRIFPSPVNERLYIIQEDINNPVNEVIIMDTSGRIIFNKKTIRITDMIIDLKTLENGTYIIKVCLRSGQVKQVFIKAD
jgi:hypothetical protein